jgi:hypothetical protein
MDVHAVAVACVASGAVCVPVVGVLQQVLQECGRAAGPQVCCAGHVDEGASRWLGRGRRPVHLAGGGGGCGAAQLPPHPHPQLHRVCVGRQWCVCVAHPAVRCGVLPPPPPNPRGLFAPQQLITDTLEKVKTLPTTDPAAYARLLHGLIVQGVKKLGEKEIKVVCRREDEPIVQAAIAAVSKDPAFAGVSVALHEQFLQAAMYVPRVRGLLLCVRLCCMWAWHGCPCPCLCWVRSRRVGSRSPRCTFAVRGGCISK